MNDERRGMKARGQLGWLRAALALALALSSTAAIGCGGDGGSDEPQGEEAEVAAVLEGTFTDPPTFCDVATDAYLEENIPSGPGLVSCEDKRDIDPGTVESFQTEVVITDGEASVGFTYVSDEGPEEGASCLVDEGGEWKISAMAEGPEPPPETVCEESTG